MNSIPSQCEVAIVGGGLAGLTAANTLHNANVDVQVFEASARLGGRIQSVRDSDTGASIADLGPTWIWPPYQEAVSTLIATLGVDLFQQYETGNAVLDMEPNGMPRHQFLPGQQGIARIAGGPQSLVDQLAEALPVASLNLRHSVVAVMREDDQFVLKLKDPALASVLATKVIVAAPLRLMQERVSWNGLLDEATLSVMKDAPTWMATQAKVSIIYKHPFWRDLGLSGRVASQVGPLVEIHDHCSFDGKHAALFGFVGIPIDDRKTSRLENEIVKQLVRCFGEEAANFEQLEIKDWAADQNICSQRDLETPPRHPETIPALIRNGLYRNSLAFAVAETATQHPGLIDGAVEAGERAARILMNSKI